jgi:hypothetical protein
MSDGTTLNVTGQAEWSSDDERVVRIDASGTATGSARGEASVSARYQSRTGTARVLVLPNGTFRLSGRITEAGFSVPGATVAVIGGTEVGLTTVSDGLGAYALYGLAGPVRLHLKKDGYLNELADVIVTDHRTADFEMRHHGPSRGLTGSYALTLTATGCSGLPATATRRSYVAAVEQDGSRLSVRLSGADLIETNGGGNNFTGVVASNGAVTFLLSDAYYYGYPLGQFDLVERLTPTSALVVIGTVNGTNGPTGISGPLNGTFAVANSVVAPFHWFSNSCRSSEHRFEMVRQ